MRIPLPICQDTCRQQLSSGGRLWIAAVLVPVSFVMPIVHIPVARSENGLESLTFAPDNSGGPFAVLLESVVWKHGPRT